MPKEGPPGSVTPEFTAASQVKYKATPSNDELLEQYSLYKVGGGWDISASPKPGFTDFAGKAKRRAWEALLETGITAEDAQKKYVELVERLKEKYGVDDA